MRALIVRIGFWFWGILYYNYDKEPPKWYRQIISVNIEAPTLLVVLRSRDAKKACEATRALHLLSCARGFERSFRAQEKLSGQMFVAPRRLQSQMAPGAEGNPEL